MSLTAAFDGVDRLVDTVDAAGRQLVDLDHVDKAHDLVSAALPRTPRLSGRLADTVDTQVAGDTIVLTAGGGGVDYAGYVHADQPWLADTIRDQTPQIIATTLDQVVEVVDTIQGA